MKKPFLTTQAGSVLKVALAMIIQAVLVNPDNLFVGDARTLIKNWVITIATACLPMLTNSINPNYPLYGAKPKASEVKDKETGQTIE